MGLAYMCKVKLCLQVLLRGQATVTTVNCLAALLAIASNSTSFQFAGNCAHALLQLSLDQLTGLLSQSTADNIAPSAQLGR